MKREQQREIITKKLEEKALKITSWVGSTESIVIHTIIFGFFILMIILGANVDTVMLVLTTIVSLEAIYLAIFIQMSVNRQAMKIAEVSEDIDEIQVDIDEIQEDIDEIQEDVSGIEEDIDEIQEDIDEIQEDVEDIEEDLGDTVQSKSAKPKAVTKQTNDELIILIKNLNKEITELKSEIKSLQKPAPNKTESLKQKVTKLLKK